MTRWPYLRRERFTIHGLWKNFDTGKWPSHCSNERFNISQLEALRPALDLMWPSYYNAPEGFWVGPLPQWHAFSICVDISVMVSVEGLDVESGCIWMAVPILGGPNDLSHAVSIGVDVSVNLSGWGPGFNMVCLAASGWAVPVCPVWSDQHDVRLRL